MSTVIVPEVRAVDCRALKAVYQKMGLSGRDVARLVHVHPSAVSRWCSGERNPSLLQLLRLTTKLGVVAWQIWTTYEETTSQDAPQRPKRRRVASTSTPNGGTPATPANDDHAAVTTTPA